MPPPFLRTVLTLPTKIPPPLTHHLKTGHKITFLHDLSQTLTNPLQPPSTNSLSPTTPTLLILHGTPGGHDSARWHATGISLFTSPPYNTRPLQILSINRPGYLTSQPPCSTYEEETTVINTFLESLGFDKVAVMGVSGGGTTALALNKYYPERLKALILMDGITKRMDMTPLQRWVYATVLGTSAITNPLAAWLFAHPKRDLPIWGKDTLREIKQDSVVRELFHQYTTCYTSGSGRRPGLVTDLTRLSRLEEEPDWGDVACPVLCLHGGKDENVGMDHPEWVMHLAERCGNGKREVVRFREGKHVLPLRRSCEIAGEWLWRVGFGDVGGD